MKIECFDSQYGVNIEFKPETVEDVALLLRLTNNAKAIKPEICLFFEGEKPSASIWLKKIQPKAQHNSIKNK